MKQRLKSDLADANNELLHQDVAISDLKNDLHDAFNRLCSLGGITARQVQELKEVRAGQI